MITVYLCGIPVAGMFYQAIVVAVLLYGAESWILPDAQLAPLEDFHVECARRLTGMRLRKRGDTSVYPKSADVLRAARLQPLRHYIQKRRATVATNVGERPILKECRGAARLRGSPVRPTWWEQDLTLPPSQKRTMSRLEWGGRPSQGEAVVHARPPTTPVAPGDCPRAAGCAAGGVGGAGSQGRGGIG